MRGLAVGVLLLSVVTVGAVAGADGVEQVDGETVDVGLSTGDTLDGSAEEVTLPNGSETTVNVVVEGASEGVGSTELSLAVDNPAVLRITDVRLEGNGTVTDAAVEDNGTTATVSAVGLQQQGEAITVVAVDVVTTGNGASLLELSVDSVGDRDGRAYDVNVTGGSAAVTVGDAAETESGADGDENDDGDGGSGLPSGALVGVLALAAVVAVGYLLYQRDV